MESRNRTVWVFVLVAVVLLACCATVAIGAGVAGWLTLKPFSTSFEGAQREAQVERVFDVGASPTLELESFAGNVTVRAGSAGTLRVIANKRAGSTTMLERIEIAWEQLDSGVRIKASRPRSMTGNMSVDFEIVAPSETSLVMDIGAGNVRVEGLAGELDVHSGAGNLSVRGAAGPIGLDVGAGNIDYEGDPTGTCRFNTGAGNISLLLPADASLQVRLDTGIGQVDVRGFDVDGEVTRTEVDGVIGGGANGSIVAGTGAGNIDLARR